jgi:hypothetical protein
MTFYPTQQTITTTFLPPPGDSLNPNLHALSLIAILYFPFKRSVPSTSLESHHITSHPPLSLHASGLGYSRRPPSPSFLFVARSVPPVPPCFHVPLCCRPRHISQPIWRVTYPAGLLFCLLLHCHAAFAFASLMAFPHFGRRGGKLVSRPD